jgi:Listeria-Bacteroides repeat domain (List_Bact_rpt).
LETLGLKGSYTINEATHAFEPAQTIGRSFDGWFYDAGFTQPATQIIGGTIGAVTIYARWETFTYTVSYRADGKTIESFSVIFRTAVPSGFPAIPAKVGHVAVGWDSVAPAVMPARGIRINAVYEPLAFIMTFNDDEGSVLSSETLPFGSLVTYPEVPARVGFEFDSWSTTISSVPAQDFTVTAAYYALKYVVTFVDDLGAPIGSSEVVFNELVTLPTPPVREGFVFVEWTGLPALMPATAVTVTGVYEAGEASQETNLNEESPIPAFPTSRPARPVIIPDVILGPHPEPVTTYVNINGTVLEISITPGQPVGELPDAVYAGYNFKGWMNGITGELILPDTIINNPDFVVLVPLFEKSASLIDAARKVFQFNPLNALPQLIPTNDLTDRDDNIVSSRPQSTNGAQSVPLQGGLEAWINLDGTVTIPLPNERTPITLRVTGLDAASLSIHYVIGEDAPEFDHPSWLLYTGEPFLTNQPGQSVFMLVKDAFDTHQVSYLRPATFITNPERIPTSSLILSSQDSSELTNTKLHTFATKIEYEDTMVDMFVIEPTEGNELQTVIVRYRANDHNKSLLLNVEAMTWREEFVAVGSSLGVYLRSGDNLEFEVEYQFNGQPSITEIFQISLEGESIGVFLAASPSAFLRAILAILILSTLIAPYLVPSKPKQ